MKKNKIIAISFLSESEWKTITEVLEHYKKTEISNILVSNLIQTINDNKIIIDRNYKSTEITETITTRINKKKKEDLWNFCKKNKITASRLINKIIDQVIY